MTNLIQNVDASPSTTTVHYQLRKVVCFQLHIIMSVM